MTGRDKRRYDMLTRVHKFATTYGQLFPDTSTAHEAFGVVAAEIDHLEALDVEERSASEVARATRKDAARQVFVDLLARAGTTARVLGHTIPQLETRSLGPLPKDDLGLLTVARQFAAGVAPYGPQFAAHAIPLPTLEAGIAAFEQAVEARANGHGDRVKARAEIEAAFGRAMHAVNTLDVIVENSSVDPVVLTMWKHDKRVKPARRSAGAAAEDTPAAVAPSAPAVAT
jgi:hypothetical protein